MMPDLLLVITTMPDADSATSLADKLITQGLAACVNIGAPVTSVYQWNEKIEHGHEVMLTIKTVSERYAELEQAIARDHPYELPEVIALPITSGLPDYLAWIESCTKR
jgi:periplasmic divalent cation tolerance protein